MQNTQWQELKEWLVSLEAIGDEVASFEGITRLDLSGRSLESLPESFGVLSNLIALNLSTNKLTTLPKSFASLTKLTNLDIRRNSFEILPELLAELPLRSINASGNHLKEISVLKSCESLRVLDLSANCIEKIEQFLPIQNDLRTLNLSCNLIKDISTFLDNLHSVERLNLSSNVIESIPKEVSALESIEEIDLSSNNISSIESEFFDLEVENVDLSANKLTELVLHSLESLDKLTLDENMFDSLEIEDYFAPYLREFSCDSCNLEEFLLPPWEHLEYLCYSSNKITKIPDEIGRYTKLIQLDIDSNAITELPDTLANLVYLQTFYAQGNPLSKESQKVLAVLAPNICDLNMKFGITIDMPEADDLKEMANLLNLLFAIEKDFTFNYDKQLAGIRQLFEDKGSEMLVAKYGEEVIGMVTMQRLISSAEGGYIGQIEDLIVKDEYRKMGVGSRLINKMRSIALEYRYKRIQLAADVDNERALAFYNKRGFHKTNLNVYHYEA